MTTVGEQDTGWQAIAGSQVRVEIIDALLNMPKDKRFNKSELADMSGVSRKSVHNHFTVLEQLGIIEEASEFAKTEYKFNTSNKVSELLIKLDGAANNTGPEVNE